jgi:hypothetical protein
MLFYLVLNKSFINKNNNSSISLIDGQNNTSSNTDQSSFLSIMEKDAKERFERRKQNYKIADGLKEKGNEQFKNGYNEKAIEFYTQVRNQEY